MKFVANDYRSVRLCLVPILALVCQIDATAVGAQTLAEVVRSVGSNSPLVQQGQARAAGAAAAARVERAAARPQLAATLDALQGTRGANAQAGFDRTLDTALSLQFPIYNGGKTAGSIRGARARAAGAAAELDRTRTGAVADAIDAYLDVLRDRDMVALNQHNLESLQQIESGTRQQFAAGDATRTDIAQARARLSLGRERLEDASSELLVAESRYRQLVGSAPGNLAPPPALPAPPGDVEAVARTALARSPAVFAADAEMRAARADVAQARADGRPKLSASVSGEYHRYEDSYAGYPNQYGGGARAAVSASVPIYSGGQVTAEIARARAGQAEAAGADEIARRRATADARRAVIDYRAQVSAVAIGQERVDAARDALTGVQADQRGGDRTVLDVLDARLELLDAEQGLLDARHDAYSAGVAVLQSVNRLDCFALASGPAADACAAAMAGT